MSDCVTVGYAYFLSFNYIFAESITELYKVYLDGDQVWSGLLTADATINFKTGKPGDTVPSGYEKSNVLFHKGGDYPMPYMQQWTGEDVKYKYLSALIFPDVFIGDGVRAIPKYGVLANNNNYTHVPGVSQVSARRANPVDVIYDILRRDLKMPESAIDVAAFQVAGDIIVNEGIWVGLVMTSEKRVSTWIDQMLNVIDGTMFYDPLTNKLSIKLLRYDYDPNNVMVITDDVINDLVLEAQSWADTYNKFTFKYTDPYRDKIASVEYTNEASRISLGYDRPKTIQLAAINHRGPLNVVANRMVVKLGVPKVALKFKIDYIDYPGLTIGGVFKINSVKLGISGKIFRVVKITGDNEDKAYLNVEAIEDFYAKDLKFDIIDDDGDLYVPPDYSIDNPVTDLKVIDAHREMTTRDAMIWACGHPINTEYVTAIHISVVGGPEDEGQPAIVCELLTAIPADSSTGPGSSPQYNQNYIFVIKDLYGFMFDITGTDTTLQHLKHTMLIGNEIVAFKKATYLGTDGRYEVEGIIRGIGGTEITSHSVGEKVYVNQVGGRFSSWVGMNTTTPTIQAYAKNHTSIGPKVTINATYNQTIKKPYKPVPYLKNGDIVWRPRVALSGANYRSADTITGGEDEGKVTGYYVVREPNGNEVTITPQTGDILITFTPTQSGTHKVKHVNADTNLDDGWVSITV